jgi:hypothetical protein
MAAATKFASETVLGDDLFGVFVDERERGVLGRQMELNFSARDVVVEINVLILGEFGLENIEDGVLQFGRIDERAWADFVAWVGKFKDSAVEESRRLKVLGEFRWICAPPEMPLAKRQIRFIVTVVEF